MYRLIHSPLEIRRVRVECVSDPRTCDSGLVCEVSCEYSDVKCYSDKFGGVRDPEKKVVRS